MSKLTDWFPPEIKPVHVGVWQVEDNAERLDHPMHGYQHWNGKRWGPFELTPEEAFVSRSATSAYQSNYWRGLAENPKGK